MAFCYDHDLEIAKLIVNDKISQHNLPYLLTDYGKVPHKIMTYKL